MTYFGTDGIRQPANKFTSDFLASIIAGLVDYAGENIKILLGGDTRESTEWILADLESACETFGLEYSSVGVLSTPAINYCFFEMGFDFAIDVTASHNPYTDNGIKIFERGKDSGVKLCEKGCEIIEKSLDLKKSFSLTSITLRESLHDEAINVYKEHLLNYLEAADLSHLKIGMDCANGATSVINKTIFEQLGAEIKLINANSNYGQAINAGCGSTHLKPITDLVTKNHLDFGVAFDGDGDRCLLVNHTGTEIDGDQIIAILANFLNLNQIAVTVMANQGLLNWAENNHIATEITAVGDSNVAEAMCLHNIKIGGEQSGHIILPGEATGDGMLTALMVAKVASKSGKSLHELASIYQKSPQIIVNLEANDQQKQSLKSSDQIKKLLLKYNQKLEPEHGRLLVRPSGTEPLIRITMWGDNQDSIDALANELKDNLKRYLT